MSEHDEFTRWMHKRSNEKLTKEHDRRLNMMRENVKDILVASFYKETQVGRSMGSSNKQGKKLNYKSFKRELLISIKKLRKLVDNKTLKNSDIRNEIKSLSGKTGASIGQAQKVINVYLKFYCLILNSPLGVIKELDCPLDSTTMNNKQRMKNILSMDEYERWQTNFEIENFGMRLLKDEEYDLKRLKKSFED